MGMYTEIFVNVDFKKETPDSVIETIRAICDGDSGNSLLADKPARWAWLFKNGSYYTPNTKCASLTFDDLAEHWSLLAKGDIKNYESEIQEFFSFIQPWSDDNFMGYHRYEEDEGPTLIFARKPAEISGGADHV